MELYQSPYEAYPFLSDDSEDLRCDFELLTDELAMRIIFSWIVIKRFCDGLILPVPQDSGCEAFDNWPKNRV